MYDIERIAEIEEHNVSTGETLESVARANGLTWEELARFNFESTDRPTVNNRLRTVVGCTRRDANGDYVFDDSDDPGIILIPQRWEATGLATDRDNTIRVRKLEFKSGLVDCCRIPGFTFEYDKSFIRPNVVDHIKRLERAIHRHPDAKIIIYGHTDRCGPPEYNKKLSDRRAKSTYAFITDRPDIWEELYQLERWGTAAIQEILTDLGFYFGPITGVSDPPTKAAIRDYQDSKDNLETDGVAGPRTRRELFLDYMTGKHDVQIEHEQFVDPPVYVGCGEFNPFTQPNSFEIANKPPGNEDNRRVIFYLFDRPPKEIPCRYYDTGPCRREMASDPDQRNDRSPQPPFKCAFYDRIASECPCERGGGKEDELVIRLLDGKKHAIPGALYRLTIAGSDVRENHADDGGYLREQGVPVPSPCTIEWGDAQAVELAGGEFPYGLDFYLDYDQGDEDETARRRLHNLGYSPDQSRDHAIRAFQRDYKIEPVTGELDPVTRAKLDEVHDQMIASNEV